MLKLCRPSRCVSAVMTQISEIKAAAEKLTQSADVIIPQGQHGLDPFENEASLRPFWDARIVMIPRIKGKFRADRRKSVQKEGADIWRQTHDFISASQATTLALGEISPDHLKSYLTDHTTAQVLCINSSNKIGSLLHCAEALATEDSALRQRFLGIHCDDYAFFLQCGVPHASLGGVQVPLPPLRVGKRAHQRLVTRDRLILLHAALRVGGVFTTFTTHEEMHSHHLSQLRQSRLVVPWLVKWYMLEATAARRIAPDGDEGKEHSIAASDTKVFDREELTRKALVPLPKLETMSVAIAIKTRNTPEKMVESNKAFDFHR